MNIKVEHRDDPRKTWEENRREFYERLQAAADKQCKPQSESA
jgi:hypothetical protein